MEKEKEKQQTWLEKPLSSILPPLTVETLFIVLIILAAVISRFYNLDLRVMSHDEVNHVVPSWDLYEGRVYRHDPVTHGPLQFHLIAFSYFLFGDNDFTSRLPHAIFNIATIILVLVGFKRYLGRKGTLIAGFLILISPYMLFYARYARNDIMVVFFLALMLYAVWRYLDTGKRSALFLLTASVVFQFVLKEVAYIHTAQLLILLAFLFFIDLYNSKWVNIATRNRFIFMAALIVIFILLAVASALWISSINKLTPITPPVETEVGAIEQAAGQSLSLPKIFLYISLFGAFLSLIYLIFFLLKNFGLSTFRTFRSFDMLMLVGSLILPLLSAFPVRFFGWDPLDYGTTGMLRTGIVVIIISVLSVLAGVLWDWRRWLWHAALFWGVFVVFYTTFFTNGQGFFTGLIGSLGYWLEQQSVQRGSQPFYYYALIQIPVYEFLPAIGMVTALVVGFWKRLLGNPQEPKADHEQLEIAPETEKENNQLPLARTPTIIPVLGILIYWALSALFAYSYAGEKMPQMTLYIALPMILSTGWVLGYISDRIDWKRIIERRGLIIVLLLVVFFASLSGLTNSFLGPQLPFQGSTLDQLRATNQFLLSFLATILSLVAIIWLMRGWRTRQVLSLGVVTFFIGLAIITLRTAFTSSYINYDTAKEYLVYAHAARGPKDILEEVEEISRRTTGGLDVKVAYDSDGLYPYWWYFRDYPNHHWFGENPSRDLRDYPLIIASENLFGKIEPVTQDNYIKFEYIRLWWPNQDYYNLTFNRVWEAFTDSQMRAAVFDIWFNRDYDRYASIKNDTSLKLETWRPADRIRLYVRKDIIAEMWDYGSAPVMSDVTMEDPYESSYVQLMPETFIGHAGVNAGEFASPRGLAIAPDGAIYVADQLNHRIQHFSANGELINVWGSYGSVLDNSAGPGTFNEPWGIAVGPDGSVYVADTWNYRIQKFTASGEFITMWGYSGQGEAPEAFYGPRGLAVDNEGNVYIADTGNKRIVVFSSDGDFISEFGTQGMELGQFDEPVSVALDDEGNVYVTDTWNQRVQVFAPTPDKQYFPVLSWEINGWFSQSIDNKPFIAVDSLGGFVFVTDPEGFRILQFDLSGNFIRVWGDYSPDIDGFGLPIGIAVDQQGKVWVSDSGNNRILGFDLSGLPKFIGPQPLEEEMPQEGIIE